MPKLKKRRLSRRSLLIIECDVKKLESDSLSIGKQVESFIKSSAEKAKVDLVQTTTESDLLMQFGELAAEDIRYKRIVIIGHSNPHGLQLCANERLSNWSRVAKWIERFEPEQLITIACEAGQAMPAKMLFDNVPTLKEFYASPLVTTKLQGYATAILVAGLIKLRSIATDQLNLLQVLNFFTTGGAIWKWRRSDYIRFGVADAVKWEIYPYMLRWLKGQCHL